MKYSFDSPELNFSDCGSDPAPSDDPFALIDADPDHSGLEERELLIGYSGRGRLLVVSFVERNDVIRIISAREADPSERERHEEETL